MSSENFPSYYLLSFFRCFKVAQPLLSLQLIELSCHPNHLDLLSVKASHGKFSATRDETTWKRAIYCFANGIPFCFSIFLVATSPIAQINKIALSDILFAFLRKVLSAKKGSTCCAHDSWKNIYLDTFTQSFFIRLE